MQLQNTKLVFKYLVIIVGVGTLTDAVKIDQAMKG